MDDLISFICTTFEIAVLAAEHQANLDGMKRTVIYSTSLNVYMITRSGVPPINNDGLEIVYVTGGDNE